MKENKLLKSLLPILKFSKKSYRPILTKGFVKDNDLYITDLESLLIVRNVGLKYGLHNIDTIHLQDAPEIDNVDDFPIVSFNIEPFKSRVCLQVSELEHLIKFASTDDTRIFLNGVTFVGNDLFSTDGYKLKVIEKSELDVCNIDEESYIMPLNFCKLLVKLVKKFKFKKDDEITLLFNDDYVSWYLEGQCYFKSRLIKRDYPKYRQVIPAKFNYSINLASFPVFKDIKPLLDRNTFNAILRCKDSLCTLIIPDSDVEFMIDNTDYTGDIRINYKDFDIVTSGLEKDALLEFNNELSPLVITTKGEFRVLMPVKL